MQLEEKNERIFKKSPFLYRDNMELVLENKKTDTNNEEMTRFLSKQLIGTMDLIILDALYLFDALNRYCLEEYINFTFPNNQKNNLKKNLAKMVSQGVILRYTYKFLDHEKKEQQTPYIYTLSRGAFGYIKRFRKKTEKEKRYKLFEGEQGLYKLVINQFYIEFLKNYTPHINHIIYDHVVGDTDNDQANIDLCFRVNTKLVSKHYIDLAVIPIRRSMDWDIDVKKRIDSVLEYSGSSRKNKIPLDEPIFVLLAEDDVHIKEIFSYLETVAEYENYMFLFTSDLMTVREPILDNLYECYSENENSIKGHLNPSQDYSPSDYDNIKKNASSNSDCVSMVLRRLLL